MSCVSPASLVSFQVSTLSCPENWRGMEELSMANRDILERFFHNPNVKSDIESQGTEKERQKVMEAGMREQEL